MRRTLLALLAVATIVSGCGGLSLGNLDEYVINWQITIDNSGFDPATITVTIRDKTQSQTVAPHATMTVTSFKPGAWSITIADSTKRKEFLQTYLGFWYTAWLKPENKNNTWMENEILKTGEALKAAGDQVAGSGGCHGAMYDASGDSLHLFAEQYGDGHWDCI